MAVILNAYSTDFENVNNGKHIRRFKDTNNKKYKLVYTGDNESNSLPSLSTSSAIPKGKYIGIYKIGKPYTILGKTYFPKEDENYEEIGESSHYGDGDGFNGKKTSNGEIFNMDDYTAAHRTLPMPSIVQVTNLENGKTLKVRINDRGPFAKDRILDVSRKVAKELDFHNKGTTKVKVKYLKNDTDNLLKKLGLSRLK
jgi:rare lipoprotein A